MIGTSTVQNDSSSNAILNAETREALRLTLDAEFIEADAFFLFEKFMEKMWDWYYVGQLPPRQTPLKRPTNVKLDKKPFERETDIYLTEAAKRLQSLSFEIKPAYIRFLGWLFFGF